MGVLHASHDLHISLSIHGPGLSLIVQGHSGQSKLQPLKVVKGDGSVRQEIKAAVTVAACSIMDDEDIPELQG